MIRMTEIVLCDDWSMDLRQLEYFVAVAEARSFTRAAEALHVAQSTVSAAVKTLEREARVPLIIRTTRSFQLSPAGEELLVRSRALLADEQAALAAVRQAEGVVSGRLRLGTPTSELPFDLPRLIGRYRQLHPAVELQLISSPAGSAGLRQETTDNRLDATFSTDLTAHPSLISREISRSPVVVIVGENHRLAGSAEVTLPEIVDEEFIDFPTGFGQRTVTDEAFSAQGLQRQVSTESSTAALIIAFVRHGLGIALLPRSTVLGRTGIRVIDLPEPAPLWRISLTWPRRRWQPPALTALLTLIDEDPGLVRPEESAD